MQIGLLERIHDKFLASMDTEGFYHYKAIVDFVLELRRFEFDAHIVIAGQNGVGKTMIALALAKMLDPKVFGKDNIIYAFHDYGFFIDKLSLQSETVVMCDELGRFFNYRTSMTRQQVALFNTIEIARANRIALIGCCRDARRLNNNYRNGKVQIVIWVIDRFETFEPYASYAMIFVANPILEHLDKFEFDEAFHGIKTIEEMRLVGEQLTTFAGYLNIFDVRRDVTDEEIAEYKNKKIRQMRAQAERNKRKAVKGDEIDDKQQSDIYSFERDGVENEESVTDNSEIMP